MFDLGLRRRHACTGSPAPSGADRRAEADLLYAAAPASECLLLDTAMHETRTRGVTRIDRRALLTMKAREYEEVCVFDIVYTLTSSIPDVEVERYCVRVAISPECKRANAIEAATKVYTPTR